MNKVCSIENCNNTHEARGYCRKHYRSLLKYNDPLHVEKKREIARLIKQISNQSKRHWASREGVCEIKGCDKPIKSRQLCDTHYSRRMRNGHFELRVKRSNIQAEHCVAIGCNKEIKSHGLCNMHLVNTRELKSPFRPKVIKLCGVKDCEERHFGRGLCSKHYYEWKRVVRDHKLAQYLELD